MVGIYYGILITLESLSISIPFLGKWGWDVCSCKQKIGKKRDISYTSYQNNIIWSDTCEITFFLHAEKRKLFFGQTKSIIDIGAKLTGAAGAGARSTK